MKTRSYTGFAALYGFLVLLLMPVLCSAQEGGTTMLQVKDNAPVPTLGSGPIKVRFYTDYFCGPCKGLEPKVEPVIASLLKRNAITITFVDAPFHRYSSLYAKYFLFVYRGVKDREGLLRARNLLFEAAQPPGKEGAATNITDTRSLEAYLTTNKVKFMPYDATPAFLILTSYLQGDKITETPTCVIMRDGKREIHKGTDNVLKALVGIK